jgi:ketosteroid isomerase-like protein
MSQETMEYAVRRLANGISSKDLAVLRAASDPHIEYTSRFTAIEGKTYRGHEGWEAYLADLEAAWEDFRVTIEEFVPVAEDKLVTIVRVNALARGIPARVGKRPSKSSAWRGKSPPAASAGRDCALGTVNPLPTSSRGDWI